MKDTSERGPKRARHGPEDDATLGDALRKATCVEAPPLEPGTPVRLAAIARSQAEESQEASRLPVRPPAARPSQPASFPGWAIAVSGLGLSAIALLAHFVPLTSRFPGSLLAMGPALNLLCSPAAAFALVQRRRQHAR
jgi:hypothetical protein